MKLTEVGGAGDGCLGSLSWARETRTFSGGG